jgi:hypothetical protein
VGRRVRVREVRQRVAEELEIVGVEGGFVILEDPVTGEQFKKPFKKMREDQES